jgi:plastocyanin
MCSERPCCPAPGLLAFAFAVIVLASSCGGGGGSSPTEPGPGPGPQSITVELHDNSFSPRSITVQPGDTVTWVLRGSAPDHTVTALNGAFNSGKVFDKQGASVTRTFGGADSNKTFDYSCQTHAVCCNMRGSVRVGNAAPPPAPGYE